MEHTLEARILGFMRNAAAGDFAQLALELFAQQFDRLEDYRSACELRGATPARVRSWPDIPAGPDGEEARGSSQGQEVLELAIPGLFAPDPVAMIVEAETTDLGQAGPILSLLAQTAAEGSLVNSGARFDSRQLRSWLGARQRDRRPVRIVATENGYRSLLDILERRSLKFRLPPGSSGYLLAAPGAETPSPSGSKVAPLQEGLADRLGLAPDACPRILCGHYGTPLLEDATQPGAFVLPHWAGASEGESGPATILDLARLDAPACYEAPAGMCRTSDRRLALGSP